MVTKFAEAALFRFAVSPSGRVRSEVRQGRADARFVRGIRLGKNVNSDEHLLATDGGVYMTRTVKRVPETEQRRADLVKSCQGSLWDWVPMRPAGRPRKAAPQAPPVATPPAATATERPSDDASERRSTKAQDLIPPVVPTSLPLFVQKRRRTNQVQHLGPRIQTVGALRWIQLRAVLMSKRIRVASARNQQISLNSHLAARLRVSSEMRVQPNFQTRDEGGGKFQQVQWTQIACEFCGRRLRGRRDR